VHCIWFYCIFEKTGFMRQILYGFFAWVALFGGLYSCIQKKTPQVEHVQTEKYSETRLKDFLDSVGHLSAFDLGKGFATNFYDIGDNIEYFDHALDEKDISMLKVAMKTNYLDTAVLKKLPLPHHEEYRESYGTYVTLYSFDDHPEDMDCFAFCFGGVGALEESDWFFFKSKKLVARHHILHRLDLKMGHFKDYDGNVVVHYNVSIRGGTGFGNSEYHFFKYDQDKLIPVLAEVKHSGMGLLIDYDLKDIEAEILKTQPLTIKFNYLRNFGHSHFNPIPQTIIEDSTLVTYHWENTCKCFVGDYRQSKLNEQQLLSFRLDKDDVYFANAHYKTLKNHLNGTDSLKKSAVLLMLENAMIRASE
jgi:hypothetical protein